MGQGDIVARPAGAYNGSDMFFFKNRFHSALLGAIVGLLLLSGIVLAVASRGWGSDTLLLLHSDRFRGADLLGFPSDAWGIWFLVVGIAILNIFLSFELYHRVPVASRAILGFTTFFSLLSLLYFGILTAAN